MDQKLKLCVIPCLCKNALQLWGLPVVRISAQSDVVYWSYCPNTHQNGHNWVLNQKNVVLLLDKVENKKYTEIETWHEEMFLL